MRGSLADYARSNGVVPLGWAGSTMQMDYLNFGDALSPVMVALGCGLPVRRVPFKSATLRMAAVGTIGHGFSGGETWFWGTGSSNWANPSAPAAEHIPFAPSADSVFKVSATRGPVSERLLNGGGRGTGVYGDPVWLLPRFYAPKVEKKWKIGVILHLSELADRTYEAHPREHIVRCVVEPEFADDVRLITTVTPISIGSLQDKIDEILACERIVSTSLHGMVVAESYGIPCLYFSPNGAGPLDLDLEPDGGTDLRIVDLYTGLGLKTRRAYGQSRAARTDWDALMRAVDANWTPVDLLDGDALLEALPVDVAPIAARPDETIWEHPVLTGLTLQHDVTELRRADKAASKAAALKTPGSPGRAPIGAAK